MSKQVFVEGEIVKIDQVATVNFSGRSRIMTMTLIMPTRLDVTGGSRINYFPWVLLPTWIKGPWRPGEHWRFVGRSIKNTAILPISNVAEVLQESRDLREWIAKFAINWINQHQERHTITALSHITASFVDGKVTPQRWYSRLRFMTGEEAPLVVPGEQLSEGLVQLNRLLTAATMPAITLCVVTQATKLGSDSLMAGTFDIKGMSH